MTGQSVAQDTYMPDRHIEVEPSPRWVRVELGGEFVADSKRVLLFRETGHLPVYYFPPADVRTDLLASVEAVAAIGEDVRRWTVRVGEAVAENAALSCTGKVDGREALSGYFAFRWDKMDHWYEEDEEVFVHPRDPYHRVDVLPSSRHVRVEAGGQLIAETRRPHLLFETGLPTRYYMPIEDIRMELLEPSTTTSRCPYKGLAGYWSVRVGDSLFPDLVWSYPTPIAECPKVKGLLCFFNERADICVDGELLPRPKTQWS